MRPHPRLLLVVLLALLVAAAPTVQARQPTPTGDAVWPLTPVPEVAESFDAPATRWGAGHRGVDLSGSLGQTVRAALPGAVSFAGSIAGRGVVVVDHGGRRTTYEPVETSVRIGTTVAAGDRIGTLQLGGSHCFPAACLHWGLRAGETYLDPLTLLGVGRVRLLPLGEALAVPFGSTPSASESLPHWAQRSRPVTLPRGDAALFRRG